MATNMQAIDTPIWRVLYFYVTSGVMRDLGRCAGFPPTRSGVRAPGLRPWLCWRIVNPSTRVNETVSVEVLGGSFAMDGWVGNGEFDWKGVCGDER